MDGSYLAGRPAYLWRQLTKRIWFRASLFSIAAILTALVAAAVAPFIPYELSLRVGGEAVDNILTILASSMLAVTTFALSAMVTAYGSATGTVTPRATQLLVEDNFTQNALSTFVGTFLFSIVGIIALTTGIYGAKGRVVLFFATVVIVLIIAITLLRWIQHLSSFGRVRDTIERVEVVARRAMSSWAQTPRFGGRPAVAIPADAITVLPDRAGYIAHIDMHALATIAEDRDFIIHVASLPGAFVHPDRPLAHVVGAVDERCRSRIANAFSVLDDREFEQDPRFGLIVLSEIASRALSPAVNDPGTAIRVIGSAHRVLIDLVDTDLAEDRPDYPRVHVPDLAIADLFTDVFRPIARDGAAMVEVQLRLQATLKALAIHAPATFAAASIDHLAAARDRAHAAMAHVADADVLD